MTIGRRAAPQALAAAHAVTTTEEAELERADLETARAQRKQGKLPHLDRNPALTAAAVLIDGLTATVLDQPLREEVGVARLAGAGGFLKEALGAVSVDGERHLLADDRAPRVDVGVEEGERVGRVLGHQVARRRRQLIEARVTAAQAIEQVVETACVPSGSKESKGSSGARRERDRERGCCPGGSTCTWTISERSRWPFHCTRRRSDGEHPGPRRR